MSRYNRITKLANSKNLSIAKLEKILGFSNGSIKNWDNAAPGADKLYKLANFFEVDPLFVLEGEIKSYDISAEHQELLNNYETFSPESQVHVRAFFKTLKEDREQVVQEHEQEKTEFEQSVQKEAEKKIIIEMLTKKADENFIKEVTNISDEEFEIIKKTFKKKKK